VSYQLPSATGSTQNIIVNYQSTYAGAPTTLWQSIWRYQSTILQSELGYGWSGFGRGANAGLGVTLAPGLQLMGRYQGISAFTNRENFSLELQSTLDFQGGSVATTRVEELRTRGGIVIQPFFDRNGNGKQDPGEESYWHSELFTLDNKALNPSQTTQLPDRVEIRSLPGSYRLDLNPVRLPPGWRNAMTDSMGKPLVSLRVNVALGSYTAIPIPLMPIYKVTGIVSDVAGKPLPNAEVTAVQISGTNVRRTTSGADGSYEFTDLGFGDYEISTPGQLQPTKIAIVASSPTLQRFDLQQAAFNRVISQTQFAIDNCGIMVFTNCWQGF
jgi:Carboxypeptidase regulatory-like domain